MNTLIIQFWKQNPARLILTLASMAIATGTIVGSLLASSAVQRAYKALAQEVAPLPFVEITSKTGGRFQPENFESIGSLEHVNAIIPTVYRGTMLRAGTFRLKCIVIGCDLSSANSTPPITLAEGTLPVGDQCVISGELANTFRVKVGDTVVMLAKRGFKNLQVSGIANQEEWFRFAPEARAMIPLKTLQSAFGLGDQVDTVRILVDHLDNRPGVLKQIQATTSSDRNILAPESRIQLGDDMLRSTNLGLTMACGLAMVMASFIILNSTRMQVSERRRDYSVLRCIGATSSQIQKLVLIETFSVGVIGSILGIGLGFVVGNLLSQGIASVVQAQATSLQWDPVRTLVPAAIVPLVGVLAAWIPILQSGRISPLEGFRAGGSQPAEPFPLKLVLGGIAAWCVSTVIVWQVMIERLPPSMAVPAGLVMLLGFILWLPLLVTPTVNGTLLIMRGPFALPAELAADQVTSRQTRTALTAGVIVVALCGSIGLGHALGNNVDEVRRWFSRALPGELLLTPYGTTTVSDELDPIRQGVLTDPDLQFVDSLRFLPARTGTLPMWVAISDFPPGGTMPTVTSPYDMEEIRRRLDAGEILISHVIANRAGIQTGGSLPLLIQGRTFDLKVAGLIQDFRQGGMTIQISRKSAQKLFLVSGSDMYIITAKKGKEKEVEQRMQTIAKEQGAHLQPMANLRASIETTLNQVVGAIWTVILMTFVASGMGVANTLAMSIREQLSELGLLRIIGMSRGQLLTLILSQAWLLCFIGTFLGSLAGITSALIMQFCNKPLLGYSPEFHWHPWLFIGSAALSFLVATIAVARPARIASRMNFLEPMTYE